MCEASGGCGYTGCELGRTENSLLRRVSAVRGRPVRLIEAPQLCGKAVTVLWVACSQEDVIYHAPAGANADRACHLQEELEKLLMDRAAFDGNRNHSELFHHVGDKGLGQVLGRA